MENEKKPESIFEQEDYAGGFGSGPLASAPEPGEEDADEPDEARDEAEDELDIDA